jgi:ParB-like chromosome segregation protein Spo0J
MAEWKATELLALRDGMTVVQIPVGDIEKNPENERIYRIGDVRLLMEDIREHGVRQPLEVAADPDHDGKWILISGHRRMEACRLLRLQGYEGFGQLPCVIMRGENTANERKIALITANATARELTDGERLAQYEALKDALTERKRAGELQGRVREELGRLLNESSGNLGRLNAISANASAEVKEMIRHGECGLTRAYEASRLPEDQQAEFARTGTVNGERVPSSAQRRAIEAEEHRRAKELAAEMQTRLEEFAAGPKETESREPEEDDEQEDEAGKALQDAVRSAVHSLRARAAAQKVMESYEEWQPIAYVAQMQLRFFGYRLEDGTIVAEVDVHKAAGEDGRVRYALFQRGHKWTGWSATGLDCLEALMEAAEG